jgi:hypothetical protein
VTHCRACSRSAETRSAAAKRCRGCAGAETLAVALSWRAAAAQRSAQFARARQPRLLRARGARCLGVRGAARTHHGAVGSAALSAAAAMRDARQGLRVVLTCNMRAFADALAPFYPAHAAQLRAHASK